MATQIYARTPERQQGGFFDTVRNLLSSIFGSQTIEYGQKPVKTGPGFDQPMMQPKGPIQGSPIAPQQEVPAEPTFRITDPIPAPQGYQINTLRNDKPHRVPDHIAQLLRQNFEPVNEATNSARVLFGENGGYKSNAVNNNRDGSVDTGLFQINSNTFNDFMKRKGNLLRKNGINTYQDMYDLNKNAAMARIIFDEQGWNAWYGAPDDLRR